MTPTEFKAQHPAPLGLRYVIGEDRFGLFDAKGVEIPTGDALEFALLPAWNLLAANESFDVPPHVESRHDDNQFARTYDRFRDVLTEIYLSVLQSEEDAPNGLFDTAALVRSYIAGLKQRERHLYARIAKLEEERDAKAFLQQPGSEN